MWVTGQGREGKYFDQRLKNDDLHAKSFIIITAIFHKNSLFVLFNFELKC